MDTDGEGRDLELRDYLVVLRQRKLTILLTAGIVVVLALVFSFLQKTTYRATAEVLLQQRTSEQIFSPNNRQDVTPDATRVLTEIQVMKSRSIQDAVTATLGKKVDVEIDTRGQTDVVSVSAEDHSADEAAHIAETYAETYVKVRRDQTVNDLLEASNEIEQQIAKVDNDIANVRAPLAELDTKIANTNDAATRTSLKQQRDQLSQSIEQQQQSLNTRRASYADQLDRLQLASNLTQTGGAQIVSQAQVPTSPVKPTPLRNGIIALFVGLILGVGQAFLRDYLDDSIRTKEDVEAVVAGAAVLTIVPQVDTWRDPSSTTVVSQSAPKSPASEAYRTLRTSVQFIGLERPVKLVQVTSPMAAEGKTTTLANLGVALARAGKRVVMVDWDLRRPRIESFFGVTNSVGFTNVMVGEHSLSEAIRRVPDEPRLAMLPSGPPPPNPAELLPTKRAADVLAALATEADYVLIDCPPVLPVADAIVVAGMVDATILVVTAHSTTKRQTARAAELLRQIDAPLVGVVLNGASAEAAYGYGDGYRYSYAYGGEGRPPKSRWARFLKSRTSERPLRQEHEVTAARRP